MSTSDIEEKTGEWSESDSRIWAAHQAMDEETLLAFVLPAEVQMIVTGHLLLLRDLDSFSPGNATTTEIELRSHALARLRGFVEAGFVRQRKVDLMARFILGEDVFPDDDEDNLRLADLDVYLDGDDCLVND